MCGLSAIIDFGPGEALLDALIAMHGEIPHRGPDGEGFCVVDGDFGVTAASSGTEVRVRTARSPAPRAGLGFRWLQIQDRSAAAAQPMASADGAVRLIFNGEIYNFRELREELRALGRDFRSASDTEVVLAAYERWGCGMFARMDGMWALVLLDLAARKLVISRDRFGIKPLFYRVDGRRLLVASEVKQLLAAGAPREANLGAVKRFIRGKRPTTPEETFFDSVSAFPAAAYCELDLRSDQPQLRFTPYWRLAQGAPGATPSFESACALLDELCATAVDEHMVAAVPVGIMVSGGLDSSVVAALSTAAFARRGERGLGFSMVLGREEAALDESPHIETLVSALGFRGFTTRFNADWLKAAMGRITRAQEEPVAGVAVAGQYLTYELAAAKGARVVLDGQGADELFGGYPRHQLVFLRECMKRGAWGVIISEAAALLRRDPALLRRGLGGLVARRAANGEVDFVLAEEKGSEDARRGSLDETLRHDVLSGNLRSVLALTDRNAMAHSIEARVPYISRSIVEFAFSIPDRYKVGAGQRKRILRKVAARHVPAQVVNRRDRIGFGAPAGRWLTQEFGAELRAMPRGPVYADSRAVDPGKTARFVEDFLSGRHADAGTVWRLYAIEHWVRAYSVNGV